LTIRYGVVRMRRENKNKSESPRMLRLQRIILFKEPNWHWNSRY
jgi:hypothetical protein